MTETDHTDHIPTTTATATDSTPTISRRAVLRGLTAVGATATLPGRVTASGDSTDTETTTPTADDCTPCGQPDGYPSEVHIECVTADPERDYIYVAAPALSLPDGRTVRHSVRASLTELARDYEATQVTFWYRGRISTAHWHPGYEVTIRHRPDGADSTVPAAVNTDVNAVKKWPPSVREYPYAIDFEAAPKTDFMFAAPRVAAPNGETGTGIGGPIHRLAQNYDATAVTLMYAERPWDLQLPNAPLTVSAYIRDDEGGD